MSTPTWRAKLQTDVRNVTQATRLASILFKRTLLHLRLSLKAVWQFGLLRSLLLLPLLIGRLIFFPLQWPLTQIAAVARSAWRWFCSVPLAAITRGMQWVVAPVRMLSYAAACVWKSVVDAARRCGRQFQELRELGFVNALALMPFLIVRTVQAAVSTVCDAVKAIGRWSGRGLRDVVSRAWTAPSQWAGRFSMTGGWRRAKTFGAGLAQRIGDAGVLRRTPAAVPAVAHVDVPVIPQRPAASPRFDSLRRSIRQNAAWALSLTAGALGLLLMVYLQWVSHQPASGDGAEAGRWRNAPVALNSPRRVDRHAANPKPVEKDGDESFPVEEAPPERAEPRGTRFDPFTSLPVAAVQEPPERATERAFAADMFENESPAADRDPELHAPDGFVDSMERADQPQLDLALDWSGPDDAFDQDMGDEFHVTAPVRVNAAAMLSGLEADEGWRELRGTIPTPSKRPAADRMRLEVPDLLIPAGPESDSNNRDQPIAEAEVESGGKELNVVVLREVPVEADVNQVMTYRILVSNRGRKTVDRVTVTERVPEGHRVVSTIPAALQQEESLVWRLSGLKPAEERSLTVQVLPMVAGSATSIVMVRPTAAVVAKTEVGGPELQLDVRAPSEVASGAACVVRFRVTNTSPRDLDDVVLRAVLSDGLSHEKGRSLDYHIDSLGAGETREARLTTRGEVVGRGKLDAQLLIGETAVQASEATVAIVEAPPVRTSRPKLPCACRR